VICKVPFPKLFQQASTAEQAVVSLIKCENLKMHQNAFDDRALPETTEEAQALPLPQTP